MAQPHKGDRRKIAIAFKRATFDKIETRAKKENKTITDMVSELTEIGLFDLEESESHEKQNGDDHATNW